jgi:1-acyl-sn-glycerol-3-phosphate acyltransferase
MRATLFVLVFAALAVLADTRVRLLRIFSEPADLALRLDAQHVRMARVLLRLASRITGLRVALESSIAGPLPAAVLVVSNHQSLIDIAAMYLALPGHHLRFVAKAELGSRVLLVSASLRYGRHAIIARGGSFSRTREALLRLARQPGVSPVVFPEGTRSRDGTVGRFHSAAVRVLIEACSLPILAVAVDGGRHLRSLSQLNRLGGVDYRVKLLGLHPRPPTREGALEVLDCIRDQIAAQQARWRGGEA